MTLTRALFSWNIRCDHHPFMIMDAHHYYCTYMVHVCMLLPHNFSSFFMLWFNLFLIYALRADMTYDMHTHTALRYGMNIFLVT